MKRLREQFRGLYWRQMSITVGMVLLTLVLLGTVFFSLSYNYARGQKTDELLERAQVVSRLSVRYLESGRYLTMEELRQDLPPSPHPITLEDVVGSTVDAVMEEEAQEPLLRPRRGLFSRKRLMETEELYAPPEPEEAPEEIPDARYWKRPCHRHHL